MIKIEDQEWMTLTDAYGSADEIPALLKRLFDDPSPKPTPKDEPWFSLWSRLCHQDDVYSASFAAVPLLVQFAELQTRPIDSSFFLLPTSIELARIQNNVPIPNVLKENYKQALEQLPQCVMNQLPFSWNEDTTKIMCATLALGKGSYELATQILDSD